MGVSSSPVMYFGDGMHYGGMVLAAKLPSDFRQRCVGHLLG
jgi:hypothetical protein